MMPDPIPIAEKPNEKTDFSLVDMLWCGAAAADGRAPAATRQPGYRDFKGRRKLVVEDDTRENARRTRFVIEPLRLPKSDGKMSGIGGTGGMGGLAVDPTKPGADG